MENPMTWNDRTKQVVEIFQKHEEEVRQGIIGLSIYRKIADFIDEELSREIAKTKMLVLPINQQNKKKSYSPLVKAISITKTQPPPASPTNITIIGEHCRE